MVDRLAWGSFFIGLGILYLTKERYGFDIWSAGLVLAGSIMIISNIVRAGWKTKVSTGSLGLGAVFLVVGVSMLGGVKLNWFALLLLLIGLWITLDALAKRR